jgi:UDP-N-acetylglucosamine--N-acetylmuramyl-(pentapeptide) pyrophosphoryl-undecaprenol N-acetylglucosamine transferase
VLVERLAAARTATRPHDPIRLLVLSGSRGERFLAARVPPLLARLREGGMEFEVHHQSGSLTPEHVRAAYAASGLQVTATADIDDMAAAYLWADLAIARAGAGTLAELALAGLPALLVPLSDAAADHQADNAQAFASAGAAIWTREDGWDEAALADELATILLDDSRWLAMAGGARQQRTPDAATRIVRDCEVMMHGRW